jgi:hypothetical protein
MNDLPAKDQTMVDAIVGAALDVLDDQLDWRACRRGKWEALHEAARRVWSTPLTNGQREAEIRALLHWCDSRERIPIVLPMLASNAIGHRLFWRMFAELWVMSDDAEHPEILQLLRKRRPPPPLPTLPSGIFTIYRGCMAEHVFGLSWTLSRAVAEQFAADHHGRMPYSVVAEAQCTCAAVFLRLADRDEGELLVDPAHIKIRAVDPLDV